jgi:myo-inositol-1(or 4)-monophosphatase
MIPEDELRQLLQTAIRGARSAGAIIRRDMKRPRNIEYKRARDMVTQTDKRAENVIIDIIQKQFPSHQIIGEESGLLNDNDSLFTWYIDPLDGTTNFVHGYPIFATSIGLTYKDEPLVGVILDPTRDELFSAAKGLGAFLNGKQMSVSNTMDMKSSILATGYYYIHDHLFALNMKLWNEIYPHTQGLRRGGAAAIDLAYVACGRLDGFWEFNLNPWDVAAGVVLIKEAGGEVIHANGDNFLTKDTKLKHIIAGNINITNTLFDIIKVHY